MAVANARTEPIIRATPTRLAATNACLPFVTNVGRRLRSGIIQKVNEDELDPRRVLHTFLNGMSTQRILLVVGGLSFVALLLAATALHAGGSTAPSSSNVTGRVTGEPINDPAVPGTPPEPQPLTPLPPPVAEAVADAPAAAGSAAAVVGSAAQVAVTAAAVATPAALPPDVIDDGPSITGSVFDHQDYINRHPVDSDRSITRSKFDREDAVDEHPVP
jgi:hypothetical protein